MRRLMLVGVFFFAATSIAQTSRPKITGISYVRFHTSNRGAAHQFFAGTLGLVPPWRESESSDIYQLNDHQRIVVDTGGESSSGNEEEIAFRTSDVRAMEKFLTARGYATIGKAGICPGFSIRGPESLRISFVHCPPKVPSAHANRMVSKRIIHVGFVVHDRAAADAFFRDLLGFKLYWTGGPNWDGTPEHVNYASMQVPDGHEWVEYMLNRPPNMTARQYGSANHVALGVVSIQNAVKKLRANGWTGTAEPRQGQDGKWQINLFDPDGTRIELMEFAPTREPCCTKYQRPHPSPIDR